MKKHTPFLPKVTLLIAILFCARICAQAQEAPLISNFTDLLIDTTSAREGAAHTTDQFVQPAEEGLFQAEEVSLGVAPPATTSVSGKELTGGTGNSLLTKFSIAYGFTRMYSRTGNEALTNGNSVSPEFDLANTSGFSLSAVAIYENDTIRNNAPSQGVSDMYGFSVNVGQDLIQLFKPASSSAGPDKNKQVEKGGPGFFLPGDSLTLSMLLGASRTHLGTTSPTLHTGTTVDSLRLAPGLTYVHQYTDSRFALTVQSLYSLAWRDSMNEYIPDYNTDGGVFSLGPRLDYMVFREGSDPKNPLKSLTFSGGVSWNHDVNEDVAPGASENYRDWAVFSCSAVHQMRMRMFGHPVDANVKVSYSYTAFRPDYDSHMITVQGTIKF